MLREIKKYPDPILHKKCAWVNQVTQEEKDLIRDMKQTMYANNGVGLAAPQIGICKRVIMVDISDGAGIRVFINPEIIEKEGKSSMEEGCLSVPGVTLNITRSKKIRVKAQDKNGEEVNLEAEDLLSHAIQHEVDHLNGILILDRASALEKIKQKFF